MALFFVDFFKARDGWRALAPREREAFTASVLAAVVELPTMGVEVVAWARNDPDTDHRAPFDYFCIYRVRDEAAQRDFEGIVQESGWYDYFEQLAVSGLSQEPAELLATLV